MSVTTPNLTTFLPVIPPSAQLFQRATTNPIGVTAASATNLGYLASNQSQLEVVGQLTSQDPVDIYTFTLQKGSSVLNAHVTNVVTSNGVAPPAAHVQLYDGSGSHILADNQGTAAQQKAFALLTSTTGLAAKSGQYIVKVTYGSGVPKTKTQNYAIQLDSGGKTFNSDYRTLAAPTTVNLTLLQGGSVGYNAAASSALLLTNVSYGNNLDIFSNAIENNANAVTSSILA